MTDDFFCFHSSLWLWHNSWNIPGAFGLQIGWWTWIKVDLWGKIKRYKSCYEMIRVRRWYNICLRVLCSHTEQRSIVFPSSSSKSVCTTRRESGRKNWSTSMFTTAFVCSGETWTVLLSWSCSVHVLVGVQLKEIYTHLMKSLFHV